MSPIPIPAPIRDDEAAPSSQSSAPQPSTPRSSTDDLCVGSRSLLYAALYAEVFSQALTREELVSYRAVAEGSETISGDASSLLDGLIGTYLEESEGLVFPTGRGDLPAIRARRAATTAVRWRVAARYAGWLRRVPFVRMVAVCGSLAVDNTEADGDVDLFLVAAPGRVWIVHTYAMVLRRLAGRPDIKVCPNLLLSRADLSVPKPDLYRAREVAQVTPLWGEATYEEFLASNGWIHEMLPSFDLTARRRHLEEGRPSKLQRFQEALLPGPVAELLDRAIHRVLVSYFQFRWRRYDPTGREVARAYSRHRQLSVAGGYGGAIGGRFVELVRRRLGRDETTERDLQRFFPAAASGEDVAPEQSERRRSAEGVARHFDQILTEDYGDPTAPQPQSARG